MKNLMFSLLLVVLVAGFASAQNSASAVGPVLVTLQGGIELGEAEFALEGLIRGFTYNVFYNPTEGVFWFSPGVEGDPLTPGEAGWTPFEIAALPYSNVTISFQYLPSQLFSSEGGGALPVSFPRAWVADDLSGGMGAAQFNPAAPFSYTTGPDGAAMFAPEMIITVPANVIGEEFSGVIVASVAYTGL